MYTNMKGEGVSAENLRQERYVTLVAKKENNKEGEATPGRLHKRRREIAGVGINVDVYVRLNVIAQRTSE